MKAYRKTEAWFRSLLTSALDGGEWSASHPGRITAGGKELAEPIAKDNACAPDRFGEEKKCFACAMIRTLDLP